MYLQSRRLILSQLTPDDIATLYSWRNNNLFRACCSTRRNAVTLTEFEQELDRDFSKDRHLQFLIYRRNTRTPIGTIYTYDYNPTDKHVFVTIFLVPEVARKGYGIEAFSILARHLFEELMLFKIYVDVYAYNDHSISIAQRGMLHEEGRFKKHRLYNRTRYDLIRFALYATDFYAKRKFVDRLTCFCAKPGL